ncbi:MAG TPA: CcdB family protein [Sphingomicrobium sp.]|nr:CcdB family protein [Sphingomicrobium sp.]
MAQFHVHRVRGGNELVVDCQSDFLAMLSTRYAVPLYSKPEAEWRFSRLTPQLTVQGLVYTFATPLGAAIDVDELGIPIASLSDQRDTILNAIDFLLTGV